MGSIGGGELLLIFLVILLVFGAKRIPEIARGLGKGIREFKEATRDIQRELTLEDPSYRARSSPTGSGGSQHPSARSAAVPSSPADHDAVQHHDEGAAPPVSPSEAESTGRRNADL